MSDECVSNPSPGGAATLISKMLSSNTSFCSPYTCSLSFPAPAPAPAPPIPTDHMEDQDVYLQFLQLFYEDGEALPAAADSAKVGKKKDRHSKINTARGPRDRRMRLSLDIARRFFHLQDLLGYDKASSTVHWLLTNAGPAIAQLDPPRPGDDANPDADADATMLMCRMRRRREKVVRRRVAVAVARESRRKARERARERTSQKRRLCLPSPFIYDHKKNILNLHTSPPLYNHHPSPPPPTFFTQEEQIAEFEFGGKPWEAFNSFHGGADCRV